jgi:hypothetical protein
VFFLVQLPHLKLHITNCIFWGLLGRKGLTRRCSILSYISRLVCHTWHCGLAGWFLLGTRDPLFNLYWVDVPFCLERGKQLGVGGGGSCSRLDAKASYSCKRAWQEPGWRLLAYGLASRSPWHKLMMGSACLALLSTCW